MLRNNQLKDLESRALTLLEASARPERLRVLQQALLALLVLWSLSSLAQWFWVLWPTPAAQVMDGSIVNPASGVGNPGQTRQPPSVDGALGLGLFGNADVSDSDAAIAVVAAPEAGIEDGARETRLALRLTGIIASTRDGLGSAVIETQNAEATYSVGDSLPVSGDVTVAKIMATQVVLNNNGTYELLRLFDDSELASLPQTRSGSTSRPAGLAPRPGSGRPVQEGASASTVANTAARNQLASSIREQLYEDPQSLASLVQVSAVRDENGLRGYRVSPGNDPQQFSALGFRPGDIITSVNGLPLSDPANTLRLYELMRDATEATVDVDRAGAVTSISVSLDALP